MKKLLLIAIFIFATGQLFAQTDGLSYQAVIINPNIQEIPGADVSGNILPNTTVSIRFTIIDANNAVEYQEVQTTTTDQYGMINLLIGVVDHDAFTLISWDGTDKELKVEIDFNGGSSFVSLSREKLTFLPYASHRNITASGTLNVDEDTFLNGELTVEEPTHLNSTLDVNNNSASNLTGDLTVGGATIIEGTTNLNSSLDVNNKSITNLSGDLNVGEDLEPNPLGRPFDEDAATKLNGTLSVVGKSNFTVQETSGLAVFGPLEADDLTVNFSSTLNGPAFLYGVTTAITGITTISGPTTISNTATITGTTTIGGATTINNTTTINGTTNLNGAININPVQEQVVINSSKTGTKNDINSYPLLIKGAKQGIAIEVNGARDNTNNYMSFWDSSTGLIHGKIQGQTLANLKDSDSYKREERRFILNNANAIAKAALGVIEGVFGGVEVIGAATSSTACVGFGACVTTPIPSLISVKAAKVILKIAKGVRYGLLVAKTANTGIEFFREKDGEVGVSYLSGAGDYAEYLSKESNSDDFLPGELVGVKNGMVSKDVWGAEKVMIVSTRPIVLGNMPQPNNEENFVKIAFMGQVPIRVIGAVSPGDYILPNLLTSGFGRAVHPKDMETRDYKKVAGVAWNIIDVNSGISLVNVAVGINTNDLSDIVYQQEEELKAIRAIAEQLQTKMEESNTVLAKLVPGYAEATGTNKSLESIQHQENAIAHNEEENYGNIIDGTAYGNDIIYFEVPRELIEEGIAQAMEVYKEAQNSQNPINKLISDLVGEESNNNKTESKAGSIEGLDKTDLMPIEDHPFWQKLNNNPAYKEEIIQNIQSSMAKSYHTHKKNISKFNEFKIRKD